MGLEQKKFKVKDCDTVYTFGFFNNGDWPITWTNSSGEKRSDRKTELFVYRAFEKGDWILLEDKEVVTQADAVNHPKHYSVFEKVEAIQVIASSMTQEQFYGYCFGNILKYRLRAGGKDDVMQELGKADRYQGLYNENKHLCKAG